MGRGNLGGGGIKKSQKRQKTEEGRSHARIRRRKVFMLAALLAQLDFSFHRGPEEMKKERGNKNQKTRSIPEKKGRKKTRRGPPPSSASKSLLTFILPLMDSQN